MLILLIDLARRLPDRQGGRRASLRTISPPASRRQRGEGYPASRRPIRSRKKRSGGRWPSIKRPWHSHNRWRLCCFHLFYEQGGTSVCSRNPDDPRRNRFAPFRLLGRESRCCSNTLIVSPSWGGFKFFLPIPAFMDRRRLWSASIPLRGKRGQCIRADSGSSGCRPGSVSRPRVWGRCKQV